MREDPVSRECEAPAKAALPGEGWKVPPVLTRVFQVDWLKGTLRGAEAAVS